MMWKRKQMASGKFACGRLQVGEAEQDSVWTCRRWDTEENGSAFACEVLSSEL